MARDLNEKATMCSVDVPASIGRVREAWTTREGVKTFFAPDVRVDLKIGGAYEIIFLPEAEPGSRGGEGVFFLALQPPTMLSFTWIAPPHLPEARKQQTHVTVRLKSLPDDETQVRLLHDGWGEGAKWDEAFDYFAKAWPAAVLPRLRHSFAVGPLRWDDLPTLEAVQVQTSFFLSSAVIVTTRIARSTDRAVLDQHRDTQRKSPKKNGCIADLAHICIKKRADQGKRKNE